MTLWDGLRVKIKQEFDHAIANKKHNFLKYDTIAKTLHPRDKQHFAVDMLNEMNKMPEAAWVFNVDIYNDPMVGEPALHVDNKSSATIQQLWYMTLMKKFWGPRRFNNIVEIGGGYGNAARIWHAHHSTATYTICDFYELWEIQKYYLNAVFGSPSIVDNISYRGLKDCWNHKGGLLQATDSMSEMPLTNRIWIENNLHHYDFIFIGYDERFDGIDNLTYFEKLAGKIQSQGYNVNHTLCSIRKKKRYILADRKKT